MNLGRPPFRFTPSTGNEVEDPAFSPFFKLLTTLIVGACAAWLVQLAYAAPGSRSSTAVLWFVAGLALMVCTWWFILRSRTRIGRDGLYQRWIWDKHMPFDDLAYAKLIRVRGLEWLIAPRLYVRTLMGKFTVFYGATPALVNEFERISTELRDFRKF